MTLIVGILCTDGVVLASDSAATFGSDGRQTIGQQAVEKVRILRNQVLYASTGAVGMAQVIANAVGAMWDENPFSRMSTTEDAMDAIGRKIAERVGPYLQTAQMTRAIGCDVSATLCKSVVALVFKKRPCLFNFDYGGAPEQASVDLPFVALGSGQAIADPFLAFLKRTVWRGKQPTIAEGKLAAVWTVIHACQTNPGGVAGPVQLATLHIDDGKPVVTRLTPDDVSEHGQQIQAAEDAMVRELKPATETEELNSPPPPPGGAR